MALFPTTIIPSYSYSVVPMFRTIRLGPSDGDFVQRRRKRVSPLHQFKMQFDALTGDQEETIHDFFIARSGAYEAFQFYDFRARDWTNITIKAASTDLTTAIVLKVTAGTSFVIYKNSSVMSTGTYSISSTSGTDGQDRLLINSSFAINSTSVIKADFHGKRYFPNCIFADDEFNRDNISMGIYRVGLTITEVST